MAYAPEVFSLCTSQLFLSYHKAAVAAVNEGMGDYFWTALICKTSDESELLYLEKLKDQSSNYISLNAGGRTQQP